MTETFLQQKFRELDQDGDGLITVQDLKKALHDIAKEFKLVLRIEESHPNLSQLISFDVFRAYLNEKISQESTLYYHSHGTVGRRSTSSALIGLPKDSSKITEDKEKESSEENTEGVQFDEVVGILSRLNEEGDEEVYAEFLHRHQPRKTTFSTLNLRI